MRQTLRRSCDACAKSKLRCDLQSPQCSRCQKRSPFKLICVYANAPLSSSLVAEDSKISGRKASMNGIAIEKMSSDSVVLLADPGAAAFDPFDSHPQTRLPRAHVQRLIHHFLSTIAFQYYPLDLQPASNPFVVSWFPLALADPALFHVSLQTASLDLDLRAQQGFTISDILMADSVSLVRHKVNDAVLAIQDETMDAVVTLAAIELGKGNADVGRTHIDGVKSMVHMRGGIQKVKATSPLTARMVAWVSMLVSQQPQFTAQDGSDATIDGIAPISQWHEAGELCTDAASLQIQIAGLDPIIGNTLQRLRNLFHNPIHYALSSTEFHDLTCFILHRLLGSESTLSPRNDLSESIRIAIALYMLLLHGPTYYSHAGLQYKLTQELRGHLEHCFDAISSTQESVAIWLISIGLVATNGTPEYLWFMVKAKETAHLLGVYDWNDLLDHLKTVLWKQKDHAEREFRGLWELVWTPDGT